MIHKDDLLRAAEVLDSCSSIALGFPHAKEYADLASSLRAAAENSVCVPREPTEAMLYAAAKASKDCGMLYTILQIRDIWRNMLAAAPGGKDE